MYSVTFSVFKLLAVLFLNKSLEECYMNYQCTLGWSTQNKKLQNLKLICLTDTFSYNLNKYEIF